MRLRDRLRGATTVQPPGASAVSTDGPSTGCTPTDVPSTVGPPAGTPVPQVGPRMLADLAACLATGSDVGRVVRGTGSAITTNVAGAEHYQRAITWAASQLVGTAGTTAPAVVLREKGRAGDPPNVRVLVHGVVVGHLFREEARCWAPVLRECEDRGVYLVGVATLREPNYEGRRTVTIALRPGLVGFTSTLAADLAADRAGTAEARRARKEATATADAVRAAAAREMTPHERTQVLATLRTLRRGALGRTREQSDDALATWATIVPTLRAHVDATGAASPPLDVDKPLVTALQDAEGAAGDLLTAGETDRPGQDHAWAGYLRDLAVALDDQVGPAASPEA